MWLLRTLTVALQCMPDRTLWSVTVRAASNWKQSSSVHESETCSTSLVLKVKAGKVLYQRNSTRAAVSLVRVAVSQVRVIAGQWQSKRE